MISQDAFSQVVSDIYRSAGDFAHWQRILPLMTETLGGNCSVLGVADDRQHFSAYVAPQTDPAFLATYNAHYHAISPLMPRIRALPAGSVVTDPMVIPREAFVKSDIYNQWILPQGIRHKLYAVLVSRPGQRVILGIHSSTEFDDEQVRLCRLFVPHLQQAMELGLRTLSLEMTLARSVEVLNAIADAVIIVGDRGRVLFANSAAQSFFEGGGSLRIEQGRLTCSLASAAAQFDRLLARCVREPGRPRAGGTMALKRSGHAQGATLTVVPFEDPQTWLLPQQPSAYVLITVPPARPEVSAQPLMDRFGLTPAEASFACRVCQGHSVTSAAQSQGIKVSTARTHLARIFDKTGTHRQGELVRTLLQL